MSSTPSQSVPAETTMGPVGITVADLDRSMGFYAAAVGLEALDHATGEAMMGVAGRPLVHLVEETGVAPSGAFTGLFHLALRVPDRPSLAAWLRHAADARVPLQGLSDHFVSEAIYLADPDGHGIEIYRDRPRELWEGRVGEMSTAPLDVSDLMGELDHDAPFAGLPAGTDMGHVHLCVADIPDTIAFYRDALGFDLMTTYGPHAAFLAAGGYHHHIGANVWQSRGAPPAPPGVASLRYVTVRFPDSGSRGDAVERVAAIGGAVDADRGEPTVRDPAAIALRLSVA